MTVGPVEVEQVGCMGHGATCCEYKIRRSKK
jgi:predicted hydrocarbon binding protein